MRQLRPANEFRLAKSRLLSRVVAVVVPVAAALSLSFAPAAVRSNAMAPPPAHTGGFGEPTCRECHFEGEANAPGGSLEIAGLPAAYEPGASYEVAVVLRRPDMERAGFQLAARFASGPAAGRQAGDLQPLDGRAEVVRHRRPAGPEAVQYARHTPAGTALTKDAEEAVWPLLWTAPPTPAGGVAEVAFHAAANAANYDDSEFGDLIYTAAASLKSHPR